MTSKSLVTTSFRTESAMSFIRNVVGNPHYVFTAKQTPYLPNDTTVPSPNTNIDDAVRTLYDNMIFGKKVTNSDVACMVPRYNWEEGVVYAQYSDDDDLLFSKKFYVCVPAGAELNVYKCLYNNNGTPSTVEPSGDDLDPFETPDDGYVWKYLYTITDLQKRKFATSTYIPVFVDSTVSNYATEGTIDAILINEGGSGYNNYFNGEFRASDIRIGGDVLVYGLVETASSFTDFYQNCVIKITSGAAEGEYRLITGYVISGGAKKITIDRAFTVPPVASDSYEIYPYVFVYGDGNETANCEARAIISPTGNTISKIEILSPGEGYRSATAEVVATASVGVQVESGLQPVISPIMGHGYNPINELGATRSCVSVKYDNDENGNIPASNDYRTVGLIKDPTFNNVKLLIEATENSTNFIDGELVYQIRPIQLTGSISVTNSVANVTGTDTFFDNSLQSGDTIFLKSDEDEYHLTTVNNIYSNTLLSITSNTSWTSNAATISIAKLLTSGNISNSSVNSITLTNVSNGVSTDYTTLFATTSKTIASLDVANNSVLTINGGSINSFQTYVQLNRFVGSIIEGTAFSDDEIVYQETDNELTQPTAVYHSENDDQTEILVSDVKHNFLLHNTKIIGNTSATEFMPTNKYPGHLVLDSGKILYVENVTPIAREGGKSETILLIFEF